MHKNLTFQLCRRFCKIIFVKMPKDARLFFKSFQIKLVVGKSQECKCHIFHKSRLVSRLESLQNAQGISPFVVV